MADKIENKPADSKDDNTGKALSNAALELMKGAMIGGALGAAAAAVDKQTAEKIAVGAAMGGVGAAIAAGVVDKNTAAKAAAGVVGGGAIIVGNEIIKENKKEIQDAGKAIENEVKRQVKEITDTPKDVMDHVKKRPVTAAAETIILGPGATIIHAKIAKWLGY